MRRQCSSRKQFTSFMRKEPQASSIKCRHLDLLIYNYSKCFDNSTGVFVNSIVQTSDIHAMKNMQLAHSKQHYNTHSCINIAKPFKEQIQQKKHCHWRRGCSDFYSCRIPLCLALMGYYAKPCEINNTVN